MSEFASAPPFAPIAHVGVLDPATRFLQLGFEHIISGADHILFVLTLLLAAESAKDIFRLTVTFTLAHSTSLVLAGSGALALTSTIVEPIIAFSIAFVAVTTVFLKHHVVASATAKVAIVFAFGLFHGLGFAGVLEAERPPRDSVLVSLASFNIGVELGQVAVVTLALPALYVVRHSRWRDVGVKVLAAALALVGLLWGVQRVAS